MRTDLFTRTGRSTPTASPGSVASEMSRCSCRQDLRRRRARHTLRPVGCFMASAMRDLRRSDEVPSESPLRHQVRAPRLKALGHGAPEHLTGHAVAGREPPSPSLVEASLSLGIQLSPTARPIFRNRQTTSSVKSLSASDAVASSSFKDHLAQARRTRSRQPNQLMSYGLRRPCNGWPAPIRDHRGGCR